MTMRSIQTQLTAAPIVSATRVATCHIIKHALSLVTITFVVVYRTHTSSVRAEIRDGKELTELSGAGHSNDVHEIGQSIMDDNLASTCILVETLDGLVMPVRDIDMVIKLNTQRNSVNILMGEFMQLTMYQASALWFYLKINVTLV